MCPLIQPHKVPASSDSAYVWCTIVFFRCRKKLCV